MSATQTPFRQRKLDQITKVYELLLSAKQPLSRRMHILFSAAFAEHRRLDTETFVKPGEFARGRKARIVIGKKLPIRQFGKRRRLKRPAAATSPLPQA